MDARVPALSAAAILVACLAAGGCGSTGTRIQSPPDVAIASLAAVDTLPSPPVSALPSVIEEACEADVDAETLWDLDQLLLDPVDLNRGSLSRLLALPSLASPHLDAIRRARPLADIDALQRLPGWDATLAQRVRPFVRLGSRRDSWLASMRASVTRDRHVVTLRLESGPVQAGLRTSGDPRDLGRGFASLGWRRLRLVVGDMGIGHGQGLLWWTSGSAIDATSAPLRRPRGVFGVDGGRGALRGAATELRLRRAHVAIVGGAGDFGTIRGAFGEVPLLCGHGMTAGWLQAERTHWFSFGWTVTREWSQCALEIAPHGGEVGYAIAAETRGERLRFGGRLQRTPAVPLAPSAGVPAGERDRVSRTALVHGTWRWARAAWEVALVQRVRQETQGRRTTNSEQRLTGRWAWPAQTFEVRLRQRRMRSEELDVESMAPPIRERRRGVVVHYGRRLRTGTSLALDYRAEENAQDIGLASGSAWQVHVGHTFRSVEAQVAMTSFAAPLAAASPVVPEPSGGPGGASRRLVGDGLRVAAVLRLQTPVVDCSFRGARTLAATSPHEVEWALALGVQLP